MAQWIGRPVPRLEDTRLLTGRGRYTDDLAQDQEGAAFAVFVRSPHAHARLLCMRTDAAAAAPGVLAVLTAAEYRADGNRPIRHAANPPDALVATRPWFVAGPDTMLIEAPQPPLAEDRVRFIGEAVAIVIAATPGQAKDAAELVEVEYEPLPAVVTASEALTSDAPLLWDSVPGNTCLSTCLGNAEAAAAGFALASLVIGRDFRNQRLVNCQMEPRAALGLWDEAEGRCTLIAGSQGVVRQRMTLAECLNLPLERVRVVSRDVGGGFGPRTPLNPEPVLVAWAARRLKVPVRWTSDRSEAFLTDYQARDLVTRADMALDDNGRILALRVALTGNVGAHTVSFVSLANGSRIVSSVYDIPAVEVRVTGVLTNTVPTAPYRGAGRPEAMFVLERLLDMAARRLEIDRIEIRRRNLIAASSMPYRTLTGLVFDSGDFRGNMEKVLRLADWDGFPARQEASRRAGRLRGIGLANYVETPVGAPRERVVLDVQPEGGVRITAGTQSTGQGHETVFAQIVAERLHVPMECVTLRTGDTDHVTVGGGTHSDRSMRLGGTLLVRACAALIDQARGAASCLLQAEPDALAWTDGHFTVEGASLDLFEVAAAMRDGQLPAQFGTALSVAEEISERIPAYPTGSAICEVELDPETGVANVLAYNSVDDVGQPINPLIVDGQVHGGIVQGIGQALHEVVAHEPGNGQVLSGSFMDYSLTRADRVPSFHVALTEDPTSGNPLRVKGGGEGGITPATAAVINAVVHALEPHGVEHIDMPATAERLWQLLQTHRA